MIRFGYSVVTLVLLFSFLLSACAAPKVAPAPSPAPAQAPAPSAAPVLSAWDKVLEAARKEGKLTIYTTWAAQAGEAAKSAMSKYGITVQTVGGSGGDLELKIKTEQRAGAYVADVFWGGWTNQLNLAKAGLAQQPPVALPVLAEKDVWKVHPTQYDSLSMVAGTGLTPAVGINIDLVKKGEVTSWNDLLDPRWRDKMVMTDPRTGSGPGASGMGQWMSLGEDFWKKIAAQRVTIHVSYDLPINQLAFGEKSVAIFPTFSRTVAAIKAGAPIQIVHTKEGTDWFLNGIILVKDAPNPNASMVFLNWLFSAEGQKTVGPVLENYSIRTDVVQNWHKIAELVPGTFTLLPSPSNLDLENPRKGAEFTKKIFGER